MARPDLAANASRPGSVLDLQPRFDPIHLAAGTFALGYTPIKKGRGCRSCAEHVSLAYALS